MRPAWFLLLPLLLLAACRSPRAASQTAAPQLLAAQATSPQVLVYGATPQGVTAAVAAAQGGASVLLLARHRSLGGVLTRGDLATLDMSYDRVNGQLLTQGLFQVFFGKIGRQISFSEARAQRAFQSMLAAAGVKVLYRVHLRKVVVSGGKIRSLHLIVQPSPASHAAPTHLTLSAGRYIDATDEAALAAASGVPYTVGRQELGLGKRMMAASLIFGLRGLSWHALASYVRSRVQLTHDGAGVNGTSMWGFSHLVANYHPSNPHRFRLRGFNLALQPGGQVLANGLLIFGVNGASPSSQALALRQGRKEIARVVAYLRARSPLFARARLSSVAKSLYIRETRHILGEVQLTPLDVLYGHRFWDRVALGSYPLDGQAYRASEPSILMGVPATYSVPFRALVPLKVTNLLVSSQAASFNPIAAFSARTVPLQMDLGQAAGTAAALSLRLRVDFHQLAKSRPEISRLQSLLRAAGALLDAPGLGVSHPNRTATGYRAAKLLFSRALFEVPYTQRGTLGLTAPMIWPTFLGDLLLYQSVTHSRAQAATAYLQREFARHHAWVPASPGGARGVLERYAALQGKKLRLPSFPSQVLNRGEAALWLKDTFSQVDSQRFAHIVAASRSSEMAASQRE